MEQSCRPHLYVVVAFLACGWHVRGSWHSHLPANEARTPRQMLREHLYMANLVPDALYCAIPACSHCGGCIVVTLTHAVLGFGGGRPPSNP